MKKCNEECVTICDFCIHFLMFKTKEGGNVDGSGYCGLHKKEVDCVEECNDFYCKTKWREDIKGV